MSFQQLVYVSRSVARIGSLLEVSDILEEAMRNNPLNNITGALAFTETRFVQILEGSQSSLDVLLLKLMLDVRHTDMKVLVREQVTERAFSDWAMISPRMTPRGQSELNRLLADEDTTLTVYRGLMLDLCREQMDALS